MNQYEYRRKTHPERYKRSWPMTITSLLLCIIVIIGMIASWRYLGHDPYVVGTVLVPAGFVAFFLLLMAANGRKHIIKEGYFDILDMLFWWRP